MNLIELIRCARSLSAANGGLLTWAHLSMVDGALAGEMQDRFDEELIQSIDTKARVITVEMITPTVRHFLTTKAAASWDIQETDRKAVIASAPPKGGDDIRSAIQNVYNTGRKLVSWSPGLALLDRGELSEVDLQATDDWMAGLGFASISLYRNEAVLACKYVGPRTLNVSERLWEISGDFTAFTCEIDPKDIKEIPAWEPPTGWDLPPEALI